AASSVTASSITASSMAASAAPASGSAAGAASATGAGASTAVAAAAAGGSASCAATGIAANAAARANSSANAAVRVRAVHPENILLFMVTASVVGSERIGVDLAGADADDLVERDDEHLAVADLAGARGAGDGLERGVEHLVRHRGLDLELGQEVDDVFGAAVQLGMALLPAEALDLGDGQARHAGIAEGFAHLVELERPDDGDDQFHGNSCVLVRGSERLRERGQHGVVGAGQVGVVPLQADREAAVEALAAGELPVVVVELAAVAAHPLPAVARAQAPAAVELPARAQAERGAAVGTGDRKSTRLH